MTHVRRAIIQVPEEMTPDAIGEIDTEELDHLLPKTEWEIDDSDGISSEGTAYIGPASVGAEPEAVVFGNDGWGYQVVAKESLRK